MPSTTGQTIDTVFEGNRKASITFDSMKFLIQNIRSLLQTRQGDELLRGHSIKELPSIDNAWLRIEDGRIADFGAMVDMDENIIQGVDEVIDATGRLVLPAYCDSHSHLIFAKTREREFEDRIDGLSYHEIAERGGGILNSADKLRAMPEDELYEAAKDRLEDLMRLGTGAIEIKSGYGLSASAELKMLRVAKRLKQESAAIIKTTFLGAHAIPREFKDNREGYIKLIVNELIPIIAENGLADYIDVFCEKGYFTIEETELILRAGDEHGLRPKIHVNQFNSIGGVKLGVNRGAISVDHLEEMSDEDFNWLEHNKTIATALPSCSFFLGIPYAPVREMISRNIPLALASDFNPGSTPSGNMNFVFSLACIKMGLNPAEALNAMTINGAAAMQIQKEVGSIAKGKRAHLILSKPMDSLARIPYSFGQPMIEEVFVGDRRFKN